MVFLPSGGNLLSRDILFPQTEEPWCKGFTRKLSFVKVVFKSLVSHLGIMLGPISMSCT